MKTLRKSLALLLALVLLLTACSPSGGNKNAASSSEDKQAGSGKDELVFIGREINSTLDPTKPQMMANSGGLEPWKPCSGSKMMEQ